MTGSPTRTPEQIHRAARQELRTLALLGVPWAPLAAASAEVERCTADSHGAARTNAPARASASESVASMGTIESKPARNPVAPSTPEPASKPATPPKPHAPMVVSSDGPKAELLAALRGRYERESVVARRITGWTNIVFGDGDPEAQIMFVGEAPGEDEDLQGIPFVGRAGKKLNDMIRAMGLARESVYIANILKVRPPNNRTPTPEEAEMDGPFLLEQIGIVQPRVIVTLGKPAAHYLLRETRSMGDLRGTWHEHHGIPVMPTYHPAYLLRAYTPENRQKVWSDLQQVVQRLQALSE